MGDAAFPKIYSSTSILFKNPDHSFRWLLLWTFIVSNNLFFIIPVIKIFEKKESFMCWRNLVEQVHCIANMNKD